MLSCVVRKKLVQVTPACMTLTASITYIVKSQLSIMHVITLLQIKGTAAGAMSPNLCKVGTSPLTAAVRRPVCIYMP